MGGVSPEVQFRRVLFSGSDLKLWLELQHLVRWGDQVLAATAYDMRQVMAQAEPQQLVAHELARG